jgi:zinc transport system substrate-binding protein
MIARPRLVLASVPALALVLAACGSATTDESASTTSPSAVAPAVSVVASFYPLEWAAQQVGGDRVEVTSLTAPGAEPHDLELTPQQVAAVTEADLVLYLAEFQPAVDDAVAQAPDNAVDVAAGIETLPAEEHSHEEGEEHSHEEGDHEHAETTYDPHVWLDPTNMVTIVETIEKRLSEADPDRAAEYAANAATTTAALTELDEAWKAGTASCANTNLVVSHEAFGYLAARYGFEQVGISGLTPDAEPSPAAIAEIAEFVKANDVKTIYSETLVDPAVAETIAAETGAATAVLDPIEGLAEGSTEDYLSIMETNLETVREGQPCS